jgi:hypothetical protein
MWFGKGERSRKVGMVMASSRHPSFKNRSTQYPSCRHPSEVVKTMEISAKRLRAMKTLAFHEFMDVNLRSITGGNWSEN